MAAVTSSGVYVCAMVPPAESMDALRAHGSPLSLALAGAFERATAGSLDEQEQALVERIEALRAKLAERTDRVDPGRYGDRTVATATQASVPREKGIALAVAIRAARPTRCLELGTNIGISAAYQAGALALNGSGNLTSIDQSVGAAGVARWVSDQLGLGNVEFEVGRFQNVLAPVLERLGRVDYAFVDGHHYEEPTVAFFEAIEARMIRPGYALFDDIRWSEEMTSAWERIAADSRVTVAVSLDKVGLCLFE